MMEQRRVSDKSSNCGSTIAERKRRRGSTECRRRSSGVGSTGSMQDIEEFLTRELRENGKVAGKKKEFQKGGNTRERIDDFRNVDEFLAATQLMLKKKEKSNRRRSSGVASIDSLGDIEEFLTSAEDQRKSATEGIAGIEEVELAREVSHPGAVWVNGDRDDFLDEDYNTSLRNQNQTSINYNQRSIDYKTERIEDNTPREFGRVHFYEPSSLSVSDDEFLVVAEAVERELDGNKSIESSTIIVTAKPDSWCRKHIWWIVSLNILLVFGIIAISIAYNGRLKNNESFPFIDDEEDLSLLSPGDSIFGVTTISDDVINSGEVAMIDIGDNKEEADHDQESSSIMGGGWTLNVDKGTISPVASSSENFVLGVTANPPLVLTKKGNSNQLVFSSQELMDINSNNKGSSGSILHGISLKDYHVGPTKHGKSITYDGSAIIDTEEDTSSVLLEFVDENFLLLRGLKNSDEDEFQEPAEKEMVLNVMNWELTEGKPVDFIAVADGEDGSSFRTGGGRDWTLNIDDGTISPRLQPDLVLGYGQKYLILSKEDSTQARRFKDLSRLENGESIPLQFITDNDSSNEKIEEIGISVIDQPKYFYQWKYFATKVLSYSNDNKSNDGESNDGESNDDNIDQLVSIKFENNQIYIQSLSSDDDDNEAFLVPSLFQIQEGVRVIFVMQE